MHTDGVFKDVVELVKENPTGIPIRKLSLFFNQKYRRNLTVSELGFSSIPSFINSLSDELLVEKQKIFHKDHRGAPAASTPANTPTVNSDSTPARPAPKASYLEADFAQRGSEMTQEELLDKVKEVIRKYPAASNSISELQNGYSSLFGSELPLKTYSSCPVVDHKQAGATCLESKSIYVDTHK